MAESFVQVAPDGAGKQLRTQTSVQGGNTVHEEVMVIADAAGNMVGTSSSLGSAQQVAIQDSAAVPFVRNAAANLAASQQSGAQMVAGPSQWSAFATPALAAQATCNRAAGGAGVRHVCKTITFTLSASTAPVATQMVIALRDGATGVGTIIWSLSIQVPAAAFIQNLHITGIDVMGSANAIMCLEFTALLANLNESVAMTGYDVV